VADTEQGYVSESAGQLQPAALSPEQQADQDEVQEIRDNFTFVKSYEDLQRRAEDEELDFEGSDMWTADARKNRSEHVDEATGRRIPAKPTLTANLLDQHIQQVCSEARQARLALSVKPRTGLASTKVANYFKGLVRIIQVDSGALSVRLWSLERTARVGRGNYKIVADYANDGDFDIDLMLKRILDQSTVYWDPFAQHAANEDAEWALETDWISEAERLRRWPKKPFVNLPDGAFDSETDDWFASEATNKQQRRVRIVTYYKVVHTTVILAYHPKVGTMLLDQMPAPIQEAVKRKEPGTRTREIDRREVVITTIDGTQVLERDRWLGRYIPIVQTVGK
jgi:hypothetical protein